MFAFATSSDISILTPATRQRLGQVKLGYAIDILPFSNKRDVLSASHYDAEFVYTSPTQLRCADGCHHPFADASRSQSRAPATRIRQLSARRHPERQRHRHGPLDARCQDQRDPELRRPLHAGRAQRKHGTLDAAPSPCGVGQHERAS